MHVMLSHSNLHSRSKCKCAICQGNFPVLHNRLRMRSQLYMCCRFFNTDDRIASLHQNYIPIPSGGCKDMEDEVDKAMRFFCSFFSFFHFQGFCQHK